MIYSLRIKLLSNFTVKKLKKVLNDFEKQAAFYSANNKLVSEANVGWHIIHSCLVITSVSKAIMNSDPALYKKKFSWKAFLVLLFNTFPRGKANAPSFTHPTEELTKEVILQHIEQARKTAELLLTTNKKKYFTHPIFGDLQIPMARRFLYVHSCHHEKIIKEILQ